MLTWCKILFWQSVSLVHYLSIYAKERYIVDFWRILRFLTLAQEIWCLFFLSTRSQWSNCLLHLCFITFFFNIAQLLISGNLVALFLVVPSVSLWYLLMVRSCQSLALLAWLENHLCSHSASCNSDALDIICVAFVNTVPLKLLRTE